MKNNHDVLHVEMCEYKIAGCLSNPDSGESGMRQGTTAGTKQTKLLRAFTFSSGSLLTSHEV